MVALGLSVTTPAPTSTRGSAPPNVVVITLDTVRRDHMGCYGYGRPTTPRMDDLAGKGILYARAYCSSSWTIPTHASLFTGRNPFEHGAHAFDVPAGTDNYVHPLAGLHRMTLGALMPIDRSRRRQV
jgi:arylsulfatase A-like enzyme